MTRSDWECCCCCFGMCWGIALVIITALGLDEFMRDVQYEMNATKEQCIISGYDEIFCTYNCDESDTCNGTMLTYYATASKCGNNTIYTNNNDFGIDCADHDYESNGYYVNKTYTCYIFPCQDSNHTNTTVEFTFEEKIQWQHMDEVEWYTVFYSMFVSTAVLVYCWGLYCSWFPWRRSTIFEKRGEIIKGIVIKKWKKFHETQKSKDRKRKARKRKMRNARRNAVTFSKPKKPATEGHYSYHLQYKFTYKDIEYQSECTYTYGAGWSELKESESFEVIIDPKHTLMYHSPYSKHQKHLKDISTDDSKPDCKQFWCCLWTKCGCLGCAFYYVLIGMGVFGGLCVGVGMYLYKKYGISWYYIIIVSVIPPVIVVIGVYFYHGLSAKNKKLNGSNDGEQNYEMIKTTEDEIQPPLDDTDINEAEEINETVPVIEEEK